MVWQIILYGITIALIIYIARSLIKTKMLTLENAFAALGIAVSVILAQNPAPAVVVTNQSTHLSSASDQVSAFVIPLLDTINGTENELSAEIPWWNFTVWGNQNGRYDPAGCFGIAWNPVGYPHTVIVFTKAQELAFIPDPAGWSGRLCVQGTDLPVTARDVGEIQKRWLSQQYKADWKVIILE